MAEYLGKWLLDARILFYWAPLLVFGNVNNKPYCTQQGCKNQTTWNEMVVFLSVPWQAFACNSQGWRCAINF